MSIEALYFSGLSILAISVCYLVITAFQYMNAPQQTQGVSQKRFMSQMLLCFAGLLIGGQFLQMHRDFLKTERETQRTTSQLQQLAASNKKPQDGTKEKSLVRPSTRPARGRLSPNESQ